jgi:hypothetical protein
MACNATECSHCLHFTTEDLDQLESVEEMYFKTREIEEEDKDDDYSDSNSSSDDEGVADQDDPGDDAVELMEIYETERAKVQAFYSKTCKCKMGAGEIIFNVGRKRLLHRPDIWHDVCFKVTV